MKVTSKGQVTIPIDIRERLGILPESEVEFEVRGDHAVLRKVTSGSGSRGRALVDHLARAGRGRVTMTTEELMALTRGDD